MFLHFTDSPTHFPHSGAATSTLDLILTKGFPTPIELSTDACLSSDHVPVRFFLSDGVNLADIPHQIVKDYSSADWRRFTSMIGRGLSITNSMNISSVEDIDAAVSLLTDTICNSDRAYIPRVRKQFSIFSLTPDILTFIGRRRSKIRRWQRTRDPLVKGRIKSLDQNIQRAISSLVNEKFSKTVHRLNSDPGPHRRKFWKLVRNLRRKPLAIPTIRTECGPLVVVCACSSCG